MCMEEEESQQHILNECKTLHRDNSTKVKIEEIFTQDTKETVVKIQDILAKLAVPTSGTNTVRSQP